MVDRTAEDDSLSEHLVSEGLPDIACRSASSQTSARRNILQALALLSGVEELAAALHANGEVGMWQPESLMRSRSMHRSISRRTHSIGVSPALSSANSGQPGAFET